MLLRLIDLATRIDILQVSMSGIKLDICVEETLVEDAGLRSKGSSCRLSQYIFRLVSRLYSQSTCVTRACDAPRRMHRPKRCSFVKTSSQDSQPRPGSAGKARYGTEAASKAGCNRDPGSRPEVALSSDRRSLQCIEFSGRLLGR